MQISHRGLTSTKTYFITASCYQKMQILQSDRMASLFIDVLLHYRRQQAYLLHEFVAMPNHFHLLITPSASLERALQFIKGGFTHRAKKELGYVGAIWQPSYYDRRVRDAEEYRRMQEYICHNPVKRGLVARPELYRYSSACPGFALDEVPQRLKPVKISA
jgi:putative transposase